MQNRVLIVTLFVLVGLLVSGCQDQASSESQTQAYADREAAAKKLGAEPNNKSSER